MAIVDNTSPRAESRSAYLRELGVGDELIPEMLIYCDPLIADDTSPEIVSWPMEDEPFAETWEIYAREAAEEGAWRVLSRYLVQLSFPIEEGVSDSADYQAATRKGVRPLIPAAPLVHDPDSISITLHPSAAGRIPVISIADRRDFITVVQALLRKNNPAPIPDSMGASMVAGYTNWDRVRRYREAWEKHNAFGDWNAAFKEFAQQKPLYQDRFILLSGGDYSGIAASDVDVDAAKWRATSIELRREHECVHYFTRRVLGSMRNSLLDELVADAVAVRNVAGVVNEKWLALFFGIEDWPDYREGGRLENYVPENLAGCFAQLTELMHLAVANVARLDSSGHASDLSSSVFIQALCSCGLDELARPGGDERFLEVCNRLSQQEK
ncbi:MAG: hypothetical protein ACI9R3_001636 [Verrucomicrobiales bacterium]|jgi:hypothetical protein